MELFNRTYLQGMHDGLVDSGVMRPFPSDGDAIAVFDKLAQEAGLPPILEAQLSKEAALSIAQRMKAASDQLASNGRGPNAQRIAMAKQAGLYDLGARASVAAAFFMEKAAADGSLTDNNENTLANAARVDQLASVDNSNRSEGTYRTPRGETDLPTPGVIGREVPAPHAPTSGTTVKAAGLESLINALRNAKNSVGGGLRNAVDTVGLHANAMGQRLSTPVSESIDAIRLGQHGRGMAADYMKDFGNMPALTSQHGLSTQMRNEGLKNLAAQGAVGLGGAGTLAGLGAGAHHLLTRGQPGAEDMQGMEVQASDASPLARALTFLVGLHQKTAGAWVPSEEAKVAAAGLGAAGTPGLEAMSTILGRAKTADDAESELHQVLQVLDAQGIPPSPELVQALSEALGEGDPGGDPPGIPGGSAPGGDGGPPQPKEGALSDIGPAAKLLRRGGEAFRDAAETIGTSAANRTRTEHMRGAASTIGKGLAGAVGIAGAAVGGKKLYDHVKGKDGEKDAEDAFWADILKAAGEGSLTENDENTLANAKKDDQIAEVDNKNRPEGTYKKPQGQTSLSTEAGEVGSEKKVAEDAYTANLKQAAADWGAKLPATMPLERKRAEIVKIASLAPNARALYVQALQG